MLRDIFGMKYVSVKQSFTEFLTMSDAIKLRLNYHQFLPLYQQSQNKKLIGKMKILSIKVISNQYLKCYISAALQLLISTSVSEMSKETYNRSQISLRVLVNVIEKVSTQKCQYWDKF